MGKSFGILSCFIISALAFVGNAQTPTYPSFTTNFATRVEVTFMDPVNIIREGSFQTKTIIVDEYHDLSEKRGFLLVDSYPFYYFGKMNQAVVVDINKKCNVMNIDEMDLFGEATYWGWLNKDKDVVGPSAFLLTYNPTYQKTEEIRGITCDKFVAKDPTGKVDLAFYIVEKGWATANNMGAPVPVRVTYNGTRSINNQDLPLQGQMDFIVFTEGVKFESIHKIPHGLGCKGLKIHPDKTFPKVNDEISFTMELFDVSYGDKEANFYVNLQRMWFDSLNKYVRIDGYDSEFVFYSEIQDFNTGVSYRTFKNDSCFLSPIQSYGTENRQKGFMGSMKSAKEFLNLNGDYYYLGMEMYRSINCEVWEAVFFNMSLGDTKYEKVVFTYYIMAPKLEQVSGGDASVQVPVALIINAYFFQTQEKPDVEALYNFFNFDEAVGRLFLSELNLQKCFEEESQKNYFAIHFPVNDTELAQALRQKDLFRDEALLQLSQWASASLLRFPFVQIYGTKDDIVLLALMLNRPPPLAGFAVYNDGNFLPTTDMKQSANVNNPEECAELCLTSDTTCRAFAVCAAPLGCTNPDSCKSQCFLGENDVSSGVDNPVRPGKFNCRRYARAVAEEVINEMDISDSLPMLNNSINNGKFVVTFNTILPDSIPTYAFKAKRLETGLKPFNEFNHELLYETVYSDFQIKDTGEAFLSFDIADPLATVQMCYERCRSDPRLSCASFSYCPSTGRCRLSPLYLSVDILGSSQNIEQATSCKVYRKRDSDFFEETPGKIPKVPGSKLLENVPTQDACAVWCKSEKKLNCKGYEYCEATKSCVLHETHNVEESRLQPNQNNFCKHYSLKYSSEFVRSPGLLVVSDDKAKTIMKISFEECAKACRENAAKCRSINFCPGSTEEDTICSINTVALSDPDVKTMDSGICQHYSVLAALEEKVIPYVPIQQIVTNGGYQSRIEVTQKLEDAGGKRSSITYYVDEFHDWRRKRGRIDVFTAGIRNSLYYFSDTKQTVSIGEKSCKVDSFQTVTFINQTVQWEWLEPKNLIAGPSSVLWRETVSVPSQMSDTVMIRGIPCIKYTAVDKKDTGVTIDYYVSSPEWKGAGATDKPIPIRVDVLGEYVPSDTSLPKQKLNIGIDFISFNPDIPKFSTFQVPAGVGCEGLKSNGIMTMPSLEDQLSYVTEAYNIFKSNEQVQNHVVIHKFWFDGINKVVAVHGVDSKFEPYKTVGDFNTGVQYKIVANGTCTMGGITDSTIRTEASGIVREMDDSNKILGLDDTYYYLGRALTRSVYCNVWETVKSDQYFRGRLYKRKVQTVYFMSPEIVSVSSSDENLQAPVKIEMRLQETDKSPVRLIEFNMFNFDDEKGGFVDIYNSINVERCFAPETQKDYFMVHFPNPNKNPKDYYLDLNSLTQNAKLVIANAAKVSLLRIASIRLFSDGVIGESDISVLGLMLDKAPPRAGFYLYIDAQAPFSSEKEVKTGVKVEDDCATACVSEATCKGYTYCKADPTKGKTVKCYLTDKDVGDDGWGDLSESDSNCQLLFRSDLNTKANEPNLTQALQNIENSVQLGKLTLQLTPAITMTASRVEKRLTPFNWQDKDLYETAFTQRKLDKGVETVKEMTAAISASDCYQQCKDEESMFCSSFSYCWADGTCRLSSVFVDAERETSLQEMEKGTATSCNVYRRAALNFFEKYSGMTTPRTGQKYQKDTASANECALACREEKSISCKGFEFCESTRQCVMHDTHTLDLEEENALKPGTPVCSHYSLKYGTEFADMGRFELTGPSSTSLNTLSFEECAKMCSESVDFDCKSLNYCPGSSVLASSCQLFAVTSDDPGYDLKLSDKCSNYIRKAQASPVAVVDVDNSGRISGGRFAGTIIGVIIFGIFLGAGAFMAYSFYRSRHQNADGTAVRYVKNP